MHTIFGEIFIYETPKSDLDVVVEKQGSSKKAIGYGVLIEIFGTTIAGVITAMLYGIYLSSKGVNEKEIMSILEDPEILTPIGLLTTVLGLCVSILAGYVCASYSVRNIKRDVILMFLITTAIVSLIAFDSSKLLQFFLLSTLSLGGVSLGAYIRWRKMA